MRRFEHSLRLLALLHHNAMLPNLRSLPLALVGAIAVLLTRRRLHPVRLRPTGETTPPIGPDDVRPGIRRLVISDLHMGAGDRLDDFTADSELAALLHHYAADPTPTELILAGDTFEFLQVRLPDVPDLEWSPRAAARRLEAILRAHPEPTAALRVFLAQPDNQVTVIIGNHDFELHYASAKQTLRRTLGVGPDDPRLRFGIYYEGDGIFLVHGNQYDRWNRFVHFGGICEPFEVVLGTRLIREAINLLEDEPVDVATLIDNIKPLSAIFWYALSLPTLRNQATRRLAARGLVLLISVLLRHTTYVLDADPRQQTRRSLWKPMYRQVALAATLLGRAAGVRQQFSLFSGAVFQREAERQMRRSVRVFGNTSVRSVARIARDPRYRSISLFICGHTHLAQIVALNERQVYINTGTWTDVIVDVAASQRQRQRFPYLEVTYPAPGSPPNWRLLVWRGAGHPPSPWRDERAPMLEKVECPV
ncbi:MAG: metallophosphoesterase [Roseiflexus sp.]|nr:metallophosphoesterase [Roseiflexus sp.]MCS7287892.1 metallophosphoesterase [Roseiflexus sp.]MDW8144866.1 metallophosphoesterase [Roseiflexaceae bacterium]MDW8233037.1 metallophosphoesterase [Roseiflexaceae bacterium]